jgi:HSP20 family protein
MTQQLMHQQEAKPAPDVEHTKETVTFTPRVDIVESDQELLLLADLPGVLAEDLDIRYENKELVISGKVSPRTAAAEYLYQDYGVGDFYRVFSVGESIDATKIVAELKQGVLTLHLPKTEKVKPRQIQVKST